MKERPIYFKQPFADQMIRAILEGRKTQVRDIVKPQPSRHSQFHHFDPIGQAVFTDNSYSSCPYGQPGDQLWVKETWQANTMPTGLPYYYRATDDDVVSPPWKSPLFMPRAASRILLEITDIRVERLQEITRSDIRSEGLVCPDEFKSDDLEYNYRHWYPNAFESLWDAMYGPGAYARNPWVWVRTFKKIEP